MKAPLKVVRRRLRQLAGQIGTLAPQRRGSSTVASRWAGLASEAFVHDLERVSWSGIPQIHQNHDYLITGSRETYWIDWMREKYFRDGDAGDTLSLGCGAGHLDRTLKQRGFTFRSFSGIDISAGAVDRARELANDVSLAPTISYTAEDLNAIELPAQAFDFIYFFQSLHHIEALEHILGQCQRALRQNGLLLINEFVGPSRFQWTPRQLELANQAAALLPEELRRDLQLGGVRTVIERPTIKHMMKHDPSEAVRSGDIEALVKTRFEVIGEWNWGGTLNHLIFQNIAGNFDPQNAYHRSIVELLIHHENVLIREGVLPSDFKVFLARHEH